MGLLWPPALQKKKKHEALCYTLIIRSETKYLKIWIPAMEFEIYSCLDKPHLLI